MKKELTEKQEKVLEFIRKFHTNNAMMPTVREIAKNFKLSQKLASYNANKNQNQLDISHVTDTRGPLNMATSIVGGAGTVYNVTTAKNVSYFRIDDPDNGKPG